MCKKLMYVVCATMVLALTPAGHALVIGNWEQDMDGWTVGQAFTDAVRFDDANGVTLGKHSLGIHLAKGDWSQGVIILNVLGQEGLLDAFKVNQKISVDVTWKMADWPTSPIPGWNGIHMVINAGGTGWSVWKTGDYQAGWTRNSGADQTLKATWDYAQWFAEMKNLQDVTWLELWLVSNCNDPAYGGPVTFYIDNMQLFGGGRALAPQPANNAKGVSTKPRLTWEPGTYASSHNVYFGADQQAVTNALGASDPTVTFATVTSPSFESNTLQFNKRYYWRVDEVNEANPSSPWTGPVWNFTTGDFIIVEDFENYDDECNRIFYAWVDGYGAPSPECGGSPIAGNGSGSTVGNFSPPFAEPTVIHGGRQSMPLTYNNTGGITFSEAIRTWETPQNWTSISKYDTLKLYVRGSEVNGADRLYITIQDNAGQTATVAHPNPAVVTDVNWIEWVVPVKEIQGVNLASVKKMTIGIGDPINPKLTMGTMFIDDIRIGPKPLGLVAYYAPEDNTNDSSGNGFHGTLAGDTSSPAVYVNGPTGFGKALSFTGAAGGQYVGLGTFNPSAATGQLSVTLWAKWNGTNNFWQSLIGKRDNWSVDDMMWQIESGNPDPVLQFQRDGAGVGFGMALPIGVWTHVAVTFDGTTARVYIDGVEKANGGFSFAYDDQASLAFGAAGAGSINPFNGALDEVRLYDKVLSPDDILKLAGK